MNPRTALIFLIAGAGAAGAESQQSAYLDSLTKARSAESAAWDRKALCEYAADKTGDAYPDLCATLDRDSTLTARWQSAQGALGKKVILGMLFGALSIGSSLIGQSHLQSNTGDCVDKVFKVSGEDCGGEPVMPFFAVGAALGIADLAVWSMPNKELQRARDLTREHYAEVFRKADARTKAGPDSARVFPESRTPAAPP